LQNLELSSTVFTNWIINTLDKKVQTYNTAVDKLEVFKNSIK
jgi:hypothetical protein